MSHKTSRFFKAIIMFIVVNLIFLTSICSFETNQDVKVSIKVKPKIDIVLAKSRTKTDVTNFEKDLLEALKKQNIDTDDVRISAVQAEQVDMTKNFAWKQDLSSSIGNISIVNNGQSVTMNGNSSNPGKNAIWIMPNKQNQDQKFTFSYNIDFGDSFNAAGMLLKVKEENNTLTGYMLSFNNSSWNNDSGGYNGAIWEFSYGIGQNSVNMTKTLKQGLSINNSGTLTVTTTDTEITIEGGGLSSKVVYTQEKEFGNGYGFFSDHYSHDCDSIGSFTLQNINLETTDAKTFDEVLRQTSWRKSSYRFLVNVTDRINNELLEASTYGELTTRLMNDNIYFVSWGNDSNKEQFTNLILQNDNKGLFIDNSDYSNSINLTAIYIREILEKIKSSEYIIVNEPVNISVDPESAKNNTANEEWPYGKWKVIHDYEYYENNMGQFADSGKYVPDFISSFDKTGRYEITYEDKEITPKYVYVHRKPVASFIMKLADGNVSLQSNSYDLDNISNNNGISEEEWQWRTSDQTTWTTGKLTNYDADKTYIIKLRVKDFQNTWSEPTAKFIYNGSDTRPIAMFNIKEDTITKYEKLNVEDQSYDPSGKELTTYLWEIYKGQELKYSGDTIPTSFLDYELGEYTLYLTVTNSNNTQSERVSRTFTVIDDTIAPEVVVTPVESDWVTSINVKLSFSDRGGSEFKQYKYAITDSQSKPSQWSEEIAEKESNILIDQEGSNKYLHIIAEDNAGNVSEDRIVGPYKIDKTGPDIKTDVDLDTVTTGNVKLVINATDNLSGLRKITINGEEYVNGSEYKIVRNGNYDIVATDNIGNSSKKRLVVNNINRVCNEGLNHPNFASSYDECPICALLKNIKITNEKFVYDSMEHRVEYDNPDNVSIKEYYNNDTNIPVKAGDYNYKLKVIYDGNEYDTHFTGTLKINKKDITITNITATNRQYNGTNVIKLKGGELQGIEDADKGKVGFVLPATGTVNSKNVGQYYVQIPEIVLNGDESNNYNLKQPDAKAVKVEISQKDITITNITTTNRQYDGTNVVKLQGGELQGIEDVDKGKVGFVLSATGTIESKNIGQYYVQIPEIVLNGDESSNYKLKQPGTKALKVEISQKDITITNITTTNRQYDGTNVVKLAGGTLQGIEKVDQGKVGFVLSATGTVESKNVGQYYVQIPEIVLNGAESNNYKLKQPDAKAVKVEISQKDITITKITATNRQYNGTNVIKLKGGELQGIEDVDQGKVGFVLSATGTVNSKNVGQYYVQIPEIVLNGAESNNYKLKQPDANAVKVEISQKDITITKITAKNRQYNGTNVVELQGGELQGIEEIDKPKVGFTLSKTGTVESKNVGQYYVQIPEIVLTGDESSNYKLKQPDKKEVSVEISQKDITITKITAKNRQYNGTNVVELQGGELQGIEEIDKPKVGFTLSKTGTVESKNVGQYYVQIPEIVLTGDESSNYKLKQPDKEDVSVEISQKDITITKITATSRQYNGTNIVELQGGELQGIEEIDKAKVGFTLSKTGTVESKNIGQYYVQIPEIVLTGEECNNYKLKQPDREDVSVEISQKDITITKITATNRQYNGTNIVELLGGELQGIEEIDKQKVGFILSKTGTVESKNIGQYYVQIPEIVLTGEECNNYKLKQPDREDVSVEISQKDITITKITATNRQYNGTNIIELQGGELQGIEEIDKEKVGFILSKTGTVESKNIGKYYVQIPEIVLTGEECNNYKLKQPDKEDVSVEISQKDITITKITATSRQYNGTNIVELQGGELQGIEEIDKEKVGFILSETGTVESKNIGKYYVQIPEIVLTGDECNNYKLKQPEKEDVSVEISQKDITITKITATSRQYDGTNVVELLGGELQGVEEIDKQKVGFILSKTGTVESKNIGQYYVQIPEITLVGRESYNYKLKQPDKEDVSVEISKKDITIKNIKAVDKLYDKNNIVKIQGGELIGVLYGEDVSFKLPETGISESEKIGSWNVKIEDISLTGVDKDNYNLIQPEIGEIKVTILEPNVPALYLETKVEEINGKENKQTGDVVRVSSNDVVKVLIKVKNKGVGAGYAQKVKIKLPDNVEMAQEETNEKYKWTQDDKNTILTDILCFENGEENEIPEKTEEGVEDTGKTLEVYLKIKDLDRKYQDIELELNVTQTDINNKVIEDKVSSTTSKLILRSNYAKNQIEEKIYSVNDVIQRDEKESNNETEVEQRDIVVYNIRIYNHGEIDSYASKIIDYPENGLEFLQQNEINQKYGWVMLDKDGEVTGNINNAVKFQSQYLSDKKIPADSSEKTSYEDIQIAFKVSDFREKNKKLENVVKIEECKDQYDNVVENIDTEKDNTIIKVKYFDLALRQNINRIQVYENGKLTKDNSLNNPGMFKVEIKQKNIEQTVVKVCYDIFVTNEGEIPGYAKEIKDIIPSGFEAKQEENEQWVINDNGELVTNQLENTLINPGETKKVTVTLTWKNAEGGLGVFENIAEISKDYNLSETLDVDSLPNNNDKNEDDYSSQKGIISIATGVVKNIIGLLIIVIFALVLLNILIRIKRKDSSCNH